VEIQSVKGKVKQQEQALSTWVDEAENMINELVAKQTGLERWAGDYQVRESG
jgi:hypothetical protein